MSGKAFILRMRPLGVSRIRDGLETDQIGIGWGRTGPQLLDPKLDRSAFADHVHRTYYGAQSNRIASGITTGQLWRFIKVMSSGDLVVVPDGELLHVAEVAGSPTHDHEDEHWAYRRPVYWLTGIGGRWRSHASDDLRRSLFSQLTCSDITPRLEDVLEFAA